MASFACLGQNSWRTRLPAVGRPDGAAGVVGPHLQLVTERYHHIYDGKKHTYKREREVSEASVGEGDKGAKKKR